MINDNGGLSVEARYALPPVFDPLAAALAFVARHYGQIHKAETLVAGLPLANGRLTLVHLPSAAERANLDVVISRQPVRSLRQEQCPLLVVLADGDVAVVSQVQGDVLSFSRASDLNHTENVLHQELTPLCTGEVIELRPKRGLADVGLAETGLTTRRWFAQGFVGTSKALGIAVLATCLVNVVALAMPLFTMNIYDRVIPNAALNTLWTLSIGATIAILFDFLVRTLRAEIIDQTGRGVDVRLANSLFGRLIGARLSSRPSSIGVQANTLRDFEAVREFFQSLTVTTLGDIPFALLFIAMVYLLGGPLVLTLLIAVPMTLLICLVIQLRLKRLMLDQHRDSAIKNAVATEVVMGIETLKALGGESWAAAKWENAMADGIRVSMRVRRLSNLASHVVIASQLLVTVLMVLHGTYLAMAGDLTVGALIACVMLAGRALGPVGQLALLLTRYNQTRVAFDSLKVIIEAEQEREPGRSFVQLDTVRGEISFESVTFAYDTDVAAALNAVSFHVRRGERAGILGAIGSGKSTALKAVVNLIAPQSGRVSIDGISTAHLDPHQLRQAVALVSQEAMLFRGSLRQNIVLHRPLATDTELLKAVEQAGAMSWIARLPRGLDTPIGERGQGLSGGQKQMIALARAYVGQPAVLLLDEPTGAMDGRSETALLASLKQDAEVNGRTLIIVTHRPAVLDIVDRLIVFDHGRIILDGPKQSVLHALKTMASKPDAGAKAPEQAGSLTAVRLA